MCTPSVKQSKIELFNSLSDVPYWFLTFNEKQLLRLLEEDPDILRFNRRYSTERNNSINFKKSTNSK